MAGQSSARIAPRTHTRPRTASTASVTPSESWPGHLHDAQRQSSGDSPNEEHEDEYVLYLFYHISELTESLLDSRTNVALRQDGSTSPYALVSSSPMYSRSACDWMSQMMTWTSQFRTCKVYSFCACSHTYAVHLSRDDNEKTLYTTAYQKIVKFILGLKKFISANQDSNSVKLYNLIGIVSR